MKSSQKKYWLMAAAGVAAVIVLCAVVAALLVREHGPAARAAQVNITSAGFEPAIIQVKKNTTVVWHNSATGPVQVESNPYPDHSILPGLYSAVIGPTGEYSYQFQQAGTFEYHDRLNPTINATVVVKD